MRKAYLLGLPLLLVLAGVFLYGDVSIAKSNRLSEEQIYRIHKEYVESTYGPGAGFRIISYGPSGVGHINHQTGEVTLYSY